MAWGASGRYLKFEAGESGLTLTASVMVKLNSLVVLLPVSGTPLHSKAGKEDCKSSSFVVRRCSYGPTRDCEDSLCLVNT